MSDMDDIEQSIMAALRKAYQLGLDDASRGRGALEAQIDIARNRIAELEVSLRAAEDRARNTAGAKERLVEVIRERDAAMDRLDELQAAGRALLSDLDKHATGSMGDSEDRLRELCLYEVPK